VSLILTQEEPPTRKLWIHLLILGPNPLDAIYLGKMITTYSKERKKTEIKKMFS
jgi:hypothetical protein